MTDILTDWWWPSPGSFDDLTVTETDDGWQLSAPDDTELAEWLSFWNQSEEHHALFQTVFIKALTDHANYVIENYGKTQAVSDEQGAHREQTEEECTGSVA